MRIIAGIFFLFFISLSAVEAQTFSAEVSAGVTASQVDGDNLSGYNKAGFVGGGGVGVSLHDRWDLKLQMLFIQKGTKTSDKDPGYLKLRSNYLEIPLVLEFYITDRFYLTGGLGVDVLLSSKFDTGFGFNDNSDLMKRFNPVLVAGLGYRLTDTFSFNARNVYSLATISEVDRQFNNTIAVYLTVHLD